MPTSVSNLVDQNGLVVGHWKVGICDCCTDVVPNACMSCICPWVSLAQIVHRIGLYSYFSALVVIGVVYLAPAIGSLAYVATGLIIWVIRNNVRRVFQIRGNACEDCLYACCCSCCTIAQMATHTDAYIKGAFCSFSPKNTLPGYVQR
ncbi:hypothetical protein SPRG_19709 [Saprolegnia parasitica CBS 223.65]|uniref:PLAC8 family protein n=1 Tax=Saprolegnia parasitica (strain CBS 223.65) TaxID=695850 RepID=A0A067CH56_SAPPC|nr:hypothetical protein SPRG_19709 [Saprolegnia parasitica CBS 223.65]KDO29823.1 hypothetical protein SPRG_19709 [Saprolegnia parasitica CBS 223.65]|eukprot:XP_012199529.1 hypothetical protein SPRG_19709 [Saprolegnia parasitica CBS 223.65]